jgi:tetratricopeptide (TPR) repeat protein
MAMRATKLLLAGAALAGAISLSMPAKSAVTVIGTGFARACFENAQSGVVKDRGLDDCNRALTEEALSSRDRAATLVNRGILYMQAKNLAKAFNDYEAALRVKPDLAEAHVNRGIALVHMGGRDGEAVAAINRGLELNTSHPEIAYYTRGIANELLGNTRAAYNDYRQASTLKPDWADPKTQLERFKVVKTSG